VLILDKIDILPPLGKYKYDTGRILLEKCYIDNSIHMRSCIKNINTEARGSERRGEHLHGVTHARIWPCPRGAVVGCCGPVATVKWRRLWS
jgi:hypothetical protein